MAEKYFLLAKPNGREKYIQFLRVVCLLDFQPVLLRALDKYFSQPEVEVLAELYNALNQMQVPAIGKSTELNRRAFSIWL